MRMFDSISQHQAAHQIAGLVTRRVLPPSMSVVDTAGRRSAEDDEEGERRQFNGHRPYQMYEAVRQQRIMYFYLSQAISDPEYFTDLIHRLYTAQPQDIIYLHLNCPGGRLDTGVNIINAMKESEARVVAVLDSKAYSLGTLMFLAADEFVIHDNCMFMIHNYSGGTAGKGNEQIAELNATVKWFEKLAKKYYYPFLTMEEIANVLEGKDMWMESTEIKQRLRNMVRIQQEEAAGTAAPAVEGKKPARKPAAKKASAKKAVKAAAVEDGELPKPDAVPVPKTPARRGRRKGDAT